MRDDSSVGSYEFLNPILIRNVPCRVSLPLINRLPDKMSIIDTYQFDFGKQSCNSETETPVDRTNKYLSQPMFQRTFGCYYCCRYPKPEGLHASNSRQDAQIGLRWSNQFLHPIKDDTSWSAVLPHNDDDAC